MRATFLSAIEDLAATRGLRILSCSAFRRTRAVGPEQPDFLNAAVLVASALPPRALLHRCQAVEAAHGRDRTREERWGPRTLDVDLLVAEGVVCSGPLLELPHPRLLDRAFALVPAAEVAPDMRTSPRGQRLAELAAGLRAPARIS